MDRSDLKNASDAIGDALDLMTDLIDILDLRAKADADEISQAAVDLVKELDVVTAERDDAEKARDALLLRVDELIADLGDL